MADKFIGLYAQLYDSFHQSKNYEFEVENFLQILQSYYFSGSMKEKNFIDFGCGTGKHISVLRDFGYKVSGYDISQDMLSIAAKLNPEGTCFYNALPANLKFDVVYSLFDVSSYQMSDQDFGFYLDELDFLASPGGVVAFDGWHTSGLRESPPEDRSKIIIFGGVEIERRVSVKLFPDSEVSELTIELFEIKSGDLLATEVHKMRSFDLNFVRFQLQQRNYVNIQFFDASDFKPNVNQDTWRFLVFASRND